MTPVMNADGGRGANVQCPEGVKVVQYDAVVLDDVEREKPMFNPCNDVSPTSERDKIHFILVTIILMPTIHFDRQSASSLLKSTFIFFPPTSISSCDHQPQSAMPFSIHFHPLS